MRFHVDWDGIQRVLTISALLEPLLEAVLYDLRHHVGVCLQCIAEKSVCVYCTTILAVFRTLKFNAANASLNSESTYLVNQSS